MSEPRRQLRGLRVHVEGREVIVQTKRASDHGLDRVFRIDATEDECFIIMVARAVAPGCHA